MKILEIINNKQKEYLMKYNELPKHIKISKKDLLNIYTSYLYIFDIPYEEVNELFGMKVELNDKLEDIEVY